MELELNKEYLEQLEAAIQDRDEAFIQESMRDRHPADISAVLDEVDTDGARYVISLLSLQTGADIISNLDSETRRKFLRAFSPEEVASFLPYIDSDDATDMLEEQPVRFREEVISHLKDPTIADDIIDLMHYDDDCAGGLMAKELIKANLNWTIDQTIEEIRRQAENVEKIFSVYVVDDFDKLLGIVSVKKLLLSKAGTLVSELYEQEIEYVESYRESWEVVEMMRKYDLEAIPVVNMAGKLLGRITIDDVIDVITEQAAEEQQIMAGISDDVEVEDSIWRSARARLPWLLIGMGGGLLGAQFKPITIGDIIFPSKIPN
jgi:magnesium transporter